MTSNYLENGRYRLVEQFKTNYVPPEGLYPILQDPIPLYEVVKAQAIQKNKIVLIKGTFDRAPVVRDFALDQAAQLESARKLIIFAQIGTKVIFVTQNIQIC